MGIFSIPDRINLEAKRQSTTLNTQTNKPTLNMFTKDTIFYKGFDKNLKCRGFQYEVGKTYTVDEPAVVCRKGFHFCHRLTDVFNYYKDINGNQFGIVEPLGELSTKEDKSASNIIKVTRLLSKEEMDKLIFIESPYFQVLKYLNANYNIIIGGSFGLYLRGIKLERDFTQDGLDLDLTLPYYQRFEGDSESGIEFDNYKEQLYTADFDNRVMIKLTNTNKQIPADLIINPRETYTNVIVDGISFKVADPLTALEAKLRYAKQVTPDGSLNKHLADLHYIINNVNDFR